MTEIDPYAVLGVSRTASRAEIAHAFRALARKHHPDAGAPPSPTMARINEAWHTLSDVNRRAKWDRQHALPVQPAHWAQAPEAPMRRPPPAPAGPPSRMDSPWIVAAVLGAIAALVAVVMIGVSVAASPDGQLFPPRLRFSTPELQFSHPDDWDRVRGAADQPDAHRILVHLVSFEMPVTEMCTVYGEPCQPSPADIPEGEASIVIMAFEGGTPPEPEPLVSRPFGLDADDMIGGRPAALERRSAPAGRQLVWYQLSPPGFPDRWIEVHAVINDEDLEESAVLRDIREMLETVEFREDAS